MPELGHTPDASTRLLNPGGTLLRRALFASNVYQAPYNLRTGLSKYWYPHPLEQGGFCIQTHVAIGCWYTLLHREITRLGGLERQRGGWAWPLAFAMLGLVYFALRGAGKAAEMDCFGWHCVAVKTCFNQYIHQMKSLLKPLVQQFPSAAQFYRNSRDLLERNQPSLPTPWGFTLAGAPQMAAGTFEPEETQLVRQLLEEVDLLVNVGANVGYYCCHALSLGKAVVAVEPISRNLNYLLRNMVENGWSQQCEIFPVALAAQTAVLRMWGGGTGASLISGWAGVPSSYVTQVPVLTLDRLLLGRMSGQRALILVDIEGAEHAMLQGAAQVLQQHPRPTWMVEISTTEHQPAGTKVNPHLLSTFDLFFAAGYQATTASQNPKKIAREDVEAATNGQGTILGGNFLFM